MGLGTRVTIKTDRQSVEFDNAGPLTIIAGPCALESRAHALECAHALREMAGRLSVGLVYKTSFDKANRTSASSARGIGLDEALPILAEVRQVTGLPVVTDVHERDQCARVGEAVDILADPGILVPPDRSVAGRCRNGARDQNQKGPVFSPVGHGPCCGESARRR